MSTLPSAAEEQPYERVKAYLEDFKLYRQGQKTVAPRDFDQLFRCQISRADWRKLQEDLRIHDDDERNPFSRCKFSYHASTSTLIIQCNPPTPVHEVAVEFLNTCLSAAVNPLHVTVAQGRGQQLDDEDADEAKVGDLTIYQETPKGLKARWVLEVGFSETYDELLEDIQTWLMAKQAEVVYGVLMKITEEPKYRCPLLNIPSEELEARRLKSRGDITRQDFVMEGEYGPSSYQGDRWAGQIKEVFWEVWKLNPETRKPELVGQRDIIVPKTNSSPKIPLHEFLTTEPANAQVSPDWDVFRALFKRNIRELAMHRYKEWNRRLAKEGGDDRGTDPDFA
ncbi:uncharacterized protein Z520_11756 [Fonsecaea multimorphosa CBS 102226]|uniref:Uncharacterized protein n=1 Tax=Fonsecaea multimorphosa CBS 102226 TaxID=1442371 RepID=A0A0D2GSX6_9EURO|nr:uncharacterized protein Z520_11756 [Fonsecaea multimorphosa CBS 102226]KIX92580.1 hypothetical protein Z520_11756 [Fonsecaea multimorphosa CBS 102226]OAL17842.1 hypothetical protein AYO22_11269 [Fonsecaea multimorphosa]